jgi:hypothetical protein
MKRKLVQPGRSLAGTGAATIRAGAREFDGGKVSKRFEALAERLLRERAKVYRALAR